jgi:hypothetical protein
VLKEYRARQVLKVPLDFRVVKVFKDPQVFEVLKVLWYQVFKVLQVSKGLLDSKDDKEFREQ